MPLRSILRYYRPLRPWDELDGLGHDQFRIGLVTLEEV